MLEGTTTISDTFRRYSTVSTVYMSGPLTISCLPDLPHVSQRTCARKEERGRILDPGAHSLFVIIRYDHINGPTHGAFVLVTVLLLMYYHYSVQFISSQHSTPELYALVRKESNWLGRSPCFC